MKKLFALLLAVLMLFSFTACGGNSNDTAENKGENNKPQASTPVKEEPEDKTDPIPVVSEEPVDTVPVVEDDTLSTPSSMLEKIITDFTTTTDSLQQKLEETFIAVGSSFDEYQENKWLIMEWTELVLTESDALFERTRENSITYFKLIATDSHREEISFITEALDLYYNTLYNEALNIYYDSLYTEAMGAFYEHYYEGIINKSSESAEINEWLDASTECFDLWYNTKYSIFEKRATEYAYILEFKTAIYIAFSVNNYDVDAIVAEFENADSDKKIENTPIPDEHTPVPSVEPEPSAEPEPAPDDGIRSEFKAAMDSYEAYIDEYCEFMEEYTADPTNLKLLAKYPEMLSKLTEMSEAFDEWDDGNLSDEELTYYLEVTTRVTKKLISVA